MIDSDYRAWDECPDVDNCELIRSFLELVDSMVRDIQHLKAETIRARYELSQKFSLRISLCFLSCRSRYGIYFLSEAIKSNLHHENTCL